MTDGRETANTALTYYGDPARKAERIKRCEAHIAADRLREATYGRIEDGKFVACAIGCQAYDIAVERDEDPRTYINSNFGIHAIIAEDYGWPKWLCRYEDAIFEGLPPEQRAGWPLRLVSAVPVGKDISPVLQAIRAFIRHESASGSAAYAKIADRLIELLEAA